MKIFCLVFSFVFLFSCQTDTDFKRAEYYETGNIKMESIYTADSVLIKQRLFYPTGNLKQERIFDHLTNEWEFYRFYENGNIAQKGIIKNGLRIGYFYHFFEEDSGKVKFKSRIFNAEGMEMMSYLESYDENGVLVNRLSNFEFDIADKIFVGDKVNYTIRINDFKDQDSAYLVLGYNEGFEKYDKLDTFSVTKSWLNLTFEANNKGVNYIRGKLIYSIISDIKADTLFEEINYRFFEKEIVVE